MANTYLSRTPSSASNRKTWTWSAWVKRSSLSTGNQILFRAKDGSYPEGIQFKSTDILEYDHDIAGTDYTVRTAMVFRDTSNWYHIMVAKDTTQATETNRIKIYVNGEQQTLTEFQLGYPPQNYDGAINKNVIHTHGSDGGGYDHFSGSMSHVHFCDGLALAPTVFGSTDSTTGQWKINASPSFTLGTNGFTILKDGNTITDQSTNSNNFSLGGGTLTKTEDCPDNVFATWNPLQATTSASYDFSAGNTRMAVNDAAVFSLGATLAATTGKYYMEMKWVQQGGNGSWGMIPIDTDISNRPRNAGVGWNQGDNAPLLLGNSVSGSWGGSIGTNDIIQLAMDLDNGAFYFGKNGTYLNSGNPTSGSSRTGAVNFSGTSLFGEQLTFAIGKGASGTDGWNANFGNGYFEQTAVSSAGTNASGIGIFEYDVPTGYTALSTKGLNL
jgi:hypothetical protein